MNKPITIFPEGHSFYYDHVHLRPEEQIGLHRQSTWELSYIIKGRGECIFGEENSSFSSGEEVLVPPELPHCWKFDKNAVDEEGKIENITLVFNTNLLDRLAFSFIEMRKQIETLKDSNCALRFTKSVASPFRHILDDMRSQSEASRLASLIYLIITFCEDIDKANMVGEIDKTTDEEKKIKKIETYVKCNFMREITIGGISSHIGMNRSSFCTFFRKAKGVTFITYLNRFRIEISCDLLSNSSANIAEICYRSGFRDIPYFDRIFKKMKGLSPKEYRAKTKNIE